MAHHKLPITISNTIELTVPLINCQHRKRIFVPNYCCLWNVGLLSGELRCCPGVKRAKFVKFLCRLSNVTFCLLTGGIVTASCHHGVVYCLKVLLRGESVRDHVDILLSMKHIPTLVINDMSGMTAKHGNHRQSGMFKPHEGRFAENNDNNLQMLRDGTLEVSLPMFDNRLLGTGHVNSDVLSSLSVGLHPITKSADVYCAADQFHLKNIKTESDKLRNIKLVKELRGQINSQVQEQLFSSLRKDVYFLNSLSPVKFLFVVRLLLHFRNEAIRESQLKAAEKLLHGTGVTVTTAAADGRINSANTATTADGIVEDDNILDNASNIVTYEQLQPASISAEVCSNEMDLSSEPLQQTSECPQHATDLLQEALRQFDDAVLHPREECLNLKDYVEVVNSTRDNLMSYSDIELDNIVHNIKRTAQLITRSVDSSRLQQIRTVVGSNGIPIQVQGISNYCGLCCINNLLGPDNDGHYTYSAAEMDNVADGLWLTLLRDTQLAVPRTLVQLRDLEGFYSYDVMHKCLQLKGFELLPCNSLLVEHFSADDFLRNVPAVSDSTTIKKLLIREHGHEHWVAVHVTSDSVYVFDSTKQSVEILELQQGILYVMHQLQKIAADDNGIVSILSQLKQTSPQIANSDRDSVQCKQSTAGVCNATEALVPLKKRLRQNPKKVNKVLMSV